MTAAVMLTGALHRDPERRTAKTTGRPFGVATIKVAAGNELEFWSLLVFNDAAMTELLRLDAGDRLSAQGSLKLEIFSDKSGTAKVGRTCIADHVVGLRQPPRQRSKGRRDAPAPARQPDMIDSSPEPRGGQR